MARIQTPQHVQDLQAEFKVREPFGLDLLETIQPTYSLGQQKVASTGYPRRCIGEINAAAGGAGTNVECVLTCPPDLGIIILLETVVTRGAAGSTSLRMEGIAPLASVVGAHLTKAYRDTRIFDSLPQGVLQDANPLTAAPNGTRVGSMATPTNVTYAFEVNVVLGSGGFFLVREDSADTVLETTFLWTEFLLEDR